MSDAPEVKKLVADATGYAMECEPNRGIRELIINRIFKHHRGCEQPGACISDVIGKGASDAPIPQSDMRAYISKMRYEGEIYFSSTGTVDVVPEGETVAAMEQAHNE